MEDVCLNTEVQSHVHDQRITSGKLYHFLIGLCNGACVRMML